MHKFYEAQKNWKHYLILKGILLTPDQKNILNKKLYANLHSWLWIQRI